MPEPWDKGVKDALANLQKAMDEKAARGWPYGIYDDSLQLLAALEDRLAKGRLPKLFKRFFWIPLNLLCRGLGQMFVAYGAAFSVVAMLAFLLLGLALVGDFQVDPLLKQAAFYFNLVLWFTVVFAAPSTYCTAGTNAKHVDTVVRTLVDWKVDDKKRVELIAQNIRVFEGRVTRRLTVFRWLLGTGWALYWSPILTHLIQRWTREGMSLMQLVVLFEPVAWLAVFYILTEGYARGVDILFRCLDLGMNERLVQIEKRLAAEQAAAAAKVGTTS